MSDMPEVKHRDIARLLGEAIAARVAVQLGVEAKAAAHDEFLSQRDKKLNADQRVTRGK